MPEIRVRRFSRDKRLLDEGPAGLPPEPEYEPEHSAFVPEEPAESFYPTNDVQDQGHDDDFLADLKVGAYNEEPKDAPVQKVPKTRKPKKTVNTAPAWDVMDEFADLFDSNRPTEILGRDRRTLLTKIAQYKTLFPNELKSFKVKPKASQQQLEEALDECDVIVSTSGIHSLLSEGYFTSIQVIEGISARTERFDISGTAAVLRANSEVMKLLKQIWLKHKLFGKCPPEAQLLIITVSTALMVRVQNQKKKQLTNILNYPLDV